MNPSSLRGTGQLPLGSLSVSLLLLLTAGPVSASVVLNGEVDPAYLYRWSRSKDAYIGKTTGHSGSVTVNDGSQLESSDVYLGYEPGTTGSATITGSGSTWSTGSHLYVGYEGSGELSIEEGAEVNNSSGYLGYHVGSSGNVAVRGPGSKWTNRGWILVGRYGTGTLTVEDGGDVIAAGLMASLEDLRGDGVITVNGAVLDADLVFNAPRSTQATMPFGSGGTLMVTADGETLGAGYKGNGSLTVTGGAAVAGRYGSLGRQPGSNGTGIVRGPGSTWTCEASMSVGSLGNGSLAIEVGGQVSNGMGFVGNGAGSTGTVTVRGAGSTWTNHGSLHVGDGGDGSLTIEDGGEVVNQDGSVGRSVGSNGSVTVRGVGSKWTNERNLYIASYGTGSLTVEDGGKVTAAVLFASTENLYGEGTITATEGAILDGHVVFDAEHGTSAAVPFGSGGTLTVVGGGNYLGTGYNGVGNLTVAEGVSVESDYGYLGYGRDSTGAATVCDPGSKWTIDSRLYVGSVGNGVLNIVAGGKVDSPLAYVGNQEGSTGAATVSGAGSKWQSAGALYIGGYGTGTLNVDAGGEAADSYGYLGYRKGSTGTATIRGAGSKWTNEENLYVGHYGDGTLTIEAGAEVTSSRGYVGIYLGSSGAVTVRGPGSRWTNSGALTVGWKGTGSLTVEDGGEITAKTLGASLDDLHGNGRITVEGAVLDADFLFDAAHATGATVPFGSGGILTVTGGEGGLCAGENGVGSLTIIEGIAVASAFGYVGLNSASVGTATVSGTGSKWTNDGRLFIGEEGYGTLTVDSGGEVSTSEAYIGHSTGAVGIVTVHGTGSKWINGKPLCVGCDGVGTFAVSGGGAVSAQEMSVNNQSFLAIDIGYGSQLTVDDGAGTLDNDGIVRLTAGPTPAAGSQHSPIAAGTWTGDGVYQPLGGTWNETTHVFIVSETLSGLSGQTLTIDLSDCQRALIEDPATGRTAGVSFLAKTGSGNTLDLTATALTPVEIVDLDGSSRPEGLLIGGWDFTAVGSGYNPEDPVYVSLAIPSNLDRNDFSIWHHDGTAWTNLDPFDLTCAGGYASFTTEGLGIFAVTVPEPSVSLLLAIGLAFAAFRRSRPAIA